MGVLKSSVLVGFRLSIYAVALTISGHRYAGRLASIRIVRASIMNDLPDLSEAPFWSGVYGAD